MFRAVLMFVVLVLSSIYVEGQSLGVIVADSATRMPLPSASVFDRNGKVIGMSNVHGRLPVVSPESYPITVRYLGYNEKLVKYNGRDTIFLVENVAELPEVIVESRGHKVLHIFAYVREYSTLTTYTDTVFLFREKMVDYMLVPDKRVKFRGWSTPRVITSRSYYKFTNDQGRDSVSDASNYHFSWSDWVGMVPSAKIPDALLSRDAGADTIRGKYSPTEIWTKNESRVMVDVNVLADKSSRKWVPNLSGFFRKDLDFENFRVRFDYNNVGADSVAPLDLRGYSFNIESNGRGHEMFKFNRADQPFFVSTYAEVYMLDKEYITIKEAKKWDKRKFDMNGIGIYEPQEAPELQPSIHELIARVENIDREQVRLDVEPNQRLVSHKLSNRNFWIGRRTLMMLKDFCGITAYKTNKKMKSDWGEFRDKVRKMNDK